jgi:hypothetical protein
MVKQSSRRRRAEPAGYGFLTVGRTARILGVSASTLRLSENVGLVSPVRSSGRYRLYSPDVLKVESAHGHRWFNPGDTEAALLWINTPPTF